MSAKSQGGFRWRIRAKAKDEKGDWIEGPYSPASFYWLRPPTTDLKYPSDGAQTVDNDKAEFSWHEQWAPAGHLFRLWKDNVIVFQKEVMGTSIIVTNLQVKTDYTWDAPAMTKTPTATHFPETYTFAHFRTANAKDEKEDGKEIKEYDPNEPEQDPEQDNGQDEPGIDPEKLPKMTISFAWGNPGSNTIANFDCDITVSGPGVYSASADGDPYEIWFSYSGDGNAFELDHALPGTYTLTMIMKNVDGVEDPLHPATYYITYNDANGFHELTGAFGFFSEGSSVVLTIPYTPQTN